MKVELEGGTFRVRWDHELNSDELPSPRQTSCMIELLQNASWETVADGVARCNPSDHFERNRGRKLSLSRALAAVSAFTAEHRRAFWAAYRDQLGHW